MRKLLNFEKVKENVLNGEKNYDKIWDGVIKVDKIPISVPNVNKVYQMKGKPSGLVVNAEDSRSKPRSLDVGSNPCFA